MGVIVVVCAAFGLIVSEAKTEIMCLRTKRTPESIATFSVEAAGQVYSQTNEFVYLGGTSTINADLKSIPSNCTADRSSPRSKNPDVQSRGTRDNAVWLRHAEPARVPQRHAGPSPPQLPDSLHRLAKERSRRPPDLLSGHAYHDGK